MESQQLVVIGASAGGVEALRQLVGGLPADLLAPVCVVLHMPPDGTSQLPRILERAGELPVLQATDGQALQNGRILVAPPDRQLLVVDGRVRVTMGPRENGHRPAIDTLFRSAAAALGPSVIGVVLSGVLDDGAAGLEAIKMHGGKALIQDPADALFPEMPLSARERVAIDRVGPANELGPLIAAIVAEAAREGGPSMPSAPRSPSSADQIPLAADTDIYDHPAGEASPYSCPECGGVLWRAEASLDPDFRCRVGHAYSFGALDRAQRDGVEAAMWTALRALEESALTARRLASDAEAMGRASAARRFVRRQAQVERQAAIIRQALSEEDPERATQAS